jgi:hypothetical protein
MRTIKPLIALVALCAAFAWSVPAMAYGHFHGGRVGVVIGAGWGPWYYPYYYGPYAPYAYSPYGYAPYGYGPAVAPATTYIEQGGGQAAPQAQASNFWYYCAEPQGYYPYVQQCRNGWQRVSPTPAQ